MSTFIGKVGGDPFMHITSDTKTQADMQGAPSATTLFHSDLPYVFVRERWRIDSYTSWGSGNGGRKFALPSDLQTFKANNEYLGYMLIVERSDGSRAIINPAPHITQSRQIDLGYYTYFDIVSAINGCEYQFAFTDDDSQLSYITRGNSFPSALTFRTWDTNDTSVTIFRSRFGEVYQSSTFTKSRPDTDMLTWDYQNRSGKDLLSQSNDCVAVEIVFLNIINSPTAFERQADYVSSEITISKDQFTVGSLDLLDFAPLMGRGSYNSGDTVTPNYGTLYGGRPAYFSISDVNNGYVSTDNTVSKDGTPVVEIPDEYQTGESLEIDFKDKYIKRGTKTIFSSANLNQGMRVLGVKEVTFDLSGGWYYEYTSGTRDLTSTQTGSFTGIDANTVYLVSAVYGGQILLSSTLMYVGQNIIFTVNSADREEGSTTVRYQYSYSESFYIDIDTDGTIIPKVRFYAKNYINILNNRLAFDWGELKVRLIALDAS